MTYTERFSETHAPLTWFAPVNRAAAVYDTAWVSMQNYHRAIALLGVGVLAQASTVDFEIRQAQDVAGTNAKAIAGKAIAQLTQAGGDGDDLDGIELRSEELDVNNGFEFVSLRLTIGVGAAFTCAILLGTVSRFNPVPTTVWTEIVP